jgi:ankyrin repeat protein
LGPNILLLTHANVNTSDAVGNSPLHCAAALGYGEIVRALLENGKAINLNAGNIDEYLREKERKKEKEDLMSNKRHTTHASHNEWVWGHCTLNMQ